MKNKSGISPKQVICDVNRSRQTALSLTVFNIFIYAQIILSLNKMPRSI